MPHISTRKVKPAGPENASILIVGEAPGFEEDKDGIPFVGQAGEQLNRILGTAGISRTDCRVTNLCNYRPADNNWDYVKDTPQLDEGLRELRSYVDNHRETLRLVILCGDKPLRYILGVKGSISSWRGSIVHRDGITYCITYHPAFVSRNLWEFPIAVADMLKFKRVHDNGYKAPVHDFVIDPRNMDLVAAVREIMSAPVISADLETSKKNPKYIRCASFGVSRERAFCFGNHSYDSMEPAFRMALTQILENHPCIVWQNGSYFDSEVLYLNGINTKIHHDIYLSQHCLNPEFEKSLAFMTSVYTDEPYYKEMGTEGMDGEKSWSDKIDNKVLYEYACIDAITTYQVYLEHQKEFENEPECLKMYLYELSQIPVQQHITRSGMLIDMERRAYLNEVLDKLIAKNQFLMNYIAGREVSANSKIVLKDVLFNQFRLKPRYSRSKKAKEGALTTEEDAVVSMIAEAKDNYEKYKTPETKEHWQKVVVFLKLLLIQRGYLKLKSSYINIDISDDGRARGIYKNGPNTGRWACSSYVDHTGWNAQTIPRDPLEIEIEEPK